jgi:hypothetical protein
VKFFGLKHFVLDDYDRISYANLPLGLFLCLWDFFSRIQKNIFHPSYMNLHLVSVSANPPVRTIFSGLKTIDAFISRDFNFKCGFFPCTGFFRCTHTQNHVNDANTVIVANTVIIWWLYLHHLRDFECVYIEKNLYIEKNRTWFLIFQFTV